MATVCDKTQFFPSWHEIHTSLNSHPKDPGSFHIIINLQQLLSSSLNGCSTVLQHFQRESSTPSPSLLKYEIACILHEKMNGYTFIMLYLSFPSQKWIIIYSFPMHHLEPDLEPIIFHLSRLTHLLSTTAKTTSMPRIGWSHMLLQYYGTNSHAMRTLDLLDIFPTLSSDVKEKSPRLNWAMAEITAPFAIQLRS